MAKNKNLNIALNRSDVSFKKTFVKIYAYQYFSAISVRPHLETTFSNLTSKISGLTQKNGIPVFNIKILSLLLNW